MIEDWPIQVWTLYVFGMVFLVLLIISIGYGFSTNDARWFVGPVLLPVQSLGQLIIAMSLRDISFRVQYTVAMLLWYTLLVVGWYAATLLNYLRRLDRESRMC